MSPLDPYRKFRFVRFTEAKNQSTLICSLTGEGIGHRTKPSGRLRFWPTAFWTIVGQI